MLRCARPCRDYCTHERALLLTVSCLAATISPKREQCSQTREGEAHVAARDRRSRPGRLYHRWLTDWPPLASSLLTAAERSGAVLVSASNLYGYGPVDGPITPETPLAATQPKLRLRAQMWRDALAAHQAGRLRTSEVRASD